MTLRNASFRFHVAASLLLLGLLSMAAEAGGVTYNVPVNGDIQAAINGASDGDTIQLAAGQYDITTTINTLGKQVTLLGTVGRNGEPTSVLDGGGAVRVLACQSGETDATVFENLVVQNGFTTGSFPGTRGGGMFNDASSPTLLNCTFAGNSADVGGGMANVNSSSPTLADCTFTGNSADAGGVGGGMNNFSSSPTLLNCTFAGNSASIVGGGMANVISSSPTLTGCTFAGNSAAEGGGMYNFSSSSPTLADCTFTGNSASFTCGGMANFSSSSPTLNDCTFTSNSAESGTGGGMYNYDDSSPTLTDCNFCGNTSTLGNRNIDGDAIDGSSSGNLLLLNCNPGDVNFDLAVDSGDLGYLLALWGASSVLNADINQDGQVNGSDLAFILSYFGGATDATTAP